MHVFQVIFHGQTTGRDSGYPTIEAVGPLFKSSKSAQVEADRLLARLSERERLTRMVTISPSTGTYSGPTVERPTYEVREVLILSISEADERQQGFISKEVKVLLDRAARLETQAQEIRNKAASAS